MLDDDARYALTNGHRYALALAINRRTGWPIIGFYDPHEWSQHLAARELYGHEPDWEDAEELPVVQHAAVRTPDGRFLDANGVHDLPADGWVPLTRAEVRELDVQRVLQRLHPGAARRARPGRSGAHRRRRPCRYGGHVTDTTFPTLTPPAGYQPLGAGLITPRAHRNVWQAALGIAANRASKIALLVADGHLELAAKFKADLDFDVDDFLRRRRRYLPDRFEIALREAADPARV